MASQFSKSGKYFAQISTEGKLKLWNTISNTFEQEFTPDFHLTSPCTCLHFIETESNKLVTPRKKKRRDSLSSPTPNIALGTSSGLLLIYSITKGELDFTINSGNSQTINCLSHQADDLVYSGVDTSVIIWDVSKRKVEKKWVTGKEKIASILVLENGVKLLTAMKSIKLWNVKSKTLLKTFTGHSYEVSILHLVSNDKSEDYFISGSKGDRLLNCWSLNEKADGKHAVATFLLEDIPKLISTSVNPADGSTKLAVNVRSGVVHIYKHTLNGKFNKPLKPKTTVQIVSNAKKDDVITPILITGVYLTDSNTLTFGYGSNLIQVFENLSLESCKKVECLLRSDPHAISKSKEILSNKTRTPIVDDAVHYVTGDINTSRGKSKRKHEGKLETTMEKRLENLSLLKLDSSSKVPKGDNVAQLLLQGLQSNDKKILQTVLYKRDEQIIKNTIKRLPMPVIVPLINEINTFITGKTLASQIGALWLKNLIIIHAGILLANPDLGELFAKSLGSIESRLALQAPLQKLKGRLDLLVSQVNNVMTQDSKEDEEAQLVYNDKDSSDSENEGLEFDAHSSSENDWNEDSTDDEAADEEMQNGGSDNNDIDDENEDEAMSS